MILVAFTAASLNSNAQFWNDTGNPSVIPGTNFLGSINPAPLDFRTANRFRARINEAVTYPSLNSFTNIPADGFTLITPDNGFLGQAPRGPFSRLHLAEGGTSGNAEQWGYRPWQKNGITFTGNDDQGYLGQKYRGGDPGFTDMVMQWSDNPGVARADRLRFIFTSQFHPGTPSGMNSEEGQEGMRLWPTYYRGINVGIGDFFAGNLIDPAISDPTERLDVLDGRVRIRQLPTDPEADTLFKFLVVDDTPSPSGERGVVKWRYLPTVPPVTTCDWTLNPTTHNNVSTAFGPVDPDCPDDGDAVGIGVNLGGSLAPAKLNVATSVFPEGANISATMATANNFGLNVSTVGGTSNNYGIKVSSSGSGGGLWRYGVYADVTSGQASRTRGILAQTNGATFTGYGGFFQAMDQASWTYGVSAQSWGGISLSCGLEGLSYANSVVNLGVYGRACDVNYNVVLPGKKTGVFGFAQSQEPTEACFGVYGSVTGPNDVNAVTKWAGYFNGDVMINGNGFLTGMVPIISDASLKTNVMDLDSAWQLLGQLHPKRYEFLVDGHPELALATGTQIGLIAQDVETVLPELVKQITIPARYDSTGAQLTSSEQFKTLNYTGLIPLLIAGYQEQQATIAQVQAQLDQCCASNSGMVPQGSGGQKSAAAMEDVREQRLTIQPNPFTDHTTLNYYVPQAGRVSLQFSTSDGKPMGTLREEQAEVGAFTYEWNTSKLSSGTYFCTYMLDGAVVVKRAVKVAR